MTELTIPTILYPRWRKPLVGLALVLVAVLAGACHQPTPAEERENRADSLISAARTAHDLDRLLRLADSLETADAISGLRADYLRGETYAQQGHLRAAEYYLKRATTTHSPATAEEAGADERATYLRAAATLAGMLANKGDYEGALQAALPAVTMIEQQGGHADVDFAILLESIGRCQLNLGRADEAAASYDRAYQYYQEVAAADSTSEGQRHIVVDTYNTALSYLSVRRYADARLWTERADSAVAHYETMADARAGFAGQVRALVNLQRATALQGLGRTSEAARYYRAYQATPYGQTDGGRIDATKYLVAAQRYAEAADNYHALNRVLGEWGYDLSLNNVQRFLFPKFRANAGAGRRDSAIAVGMQILDVLDSAIVHDKTDDAAELATIYATQQKETQIAHQQAEIAGKDAELSRQRWIGTAAVLVLVTLFFVAYTLNRRREAKNLAEKNRLLEMANARAEESSKMKTNFIRQISHEIRTPLNILSGFTQVITAQGAELTDEEKTDISQRITESTTRIIGLVNKMLELSDASSQTVIERTGHVTAAQIATDAAAESGVEETPHVSFTLHVAEEAGSTSLLTNRTAAVRALTLLLDNACKFTRPAETFSLDEVKRESVVLRVTVAGGVVQFVVEDTGIGIPPEEAEHIFDEFVQLDDYYDGTGIGLTIARSLARRLGGDIVLDTTYTASGSGARFLMTLPIA